MRRNRGGNLRSPAKGIGRPELQNGCYFSRSVKQFATHFEAATSTSAFLLLGTLLAASGTATKDCGPSARLNVHSKAADRTDLSMHDRPSNAESRLSGFPSSSSTTRDGTIATVIGTGELTLTLKGSPSLSALIPS